ncbi:hypothetical protein BT63DRAFT_190955 [Microthyrium microscopicum]|uniref:Uncharacterized protein n=1 Tax=Microthyrium microscopicum TaxID=703497 RepID=A0A6A6UL53_9PEZI|nr:hypothetical protein BT63DRAFT_190955 [Microthyrium microscopicum]
MWTATSSRTFRSRQLRRFLLTYLTAVLIPLLFILGVHLKNIRWYYNDTLKQTALTESILSQYKRSHNVSHTLVMGRTRKDDLSWISRELPDINTAIYSVDDLHAPLHTRANKGHEAMPYLSYIIDNYYNLPDVVLFFHPHQKATHNNLVLDRDTAKTILQMDLEQVYRDGYANTRCERVPGCPAWLRFDLPEEKLNRYERKEEEFLTSKLWRDLYQGATPPASIGQSCCAQLAVSRNAIRARPLSSYVHYRDWLMSTPLEDGISGRIFEHSWQYMLGGVAEFCPTELDCLYRNYGMLFRSAEDLKDYQNKLWRKAHWSWRFWQNSAALENELNLRKIEAFKRGYLRKRAEAATPFAFDHSAFQRKIPLRL